MYCPQCKYTSFDHLPKCPKCSLDWMEQRKQLNLGWLDVPEDLPQQAGASTAQDLKNRQQASSFSPEALGQEAKEPATDEDPSSSQHRLSQEESIQGAGPGSMEPGKEENQKEPPRPAASSRENAGRRTGEQVASEADLEEISFPELEDFFLAPESGDKAAAEDKADRAGGSDEDIEPVLDFEPEPPQEETGKQASSKAGSAEEEEEISEYELDLDISSLIDDLEVEPDDDGDAEPKRPGS